MGKLLYWAIAQQLVVLGTRIEDFPTAALKRGKKAQKIQSRAKTSFMMSLGKINNKNNQTKTDVFFGFQILQTVTDNQIVQSVMFLVLHHYKPELHI